MATQFDSLARDSLEVFRPWPRYPDSSTPRLPERHVRLLSSAHTQASQPKRRWTTRQRADVSALAPLLPSTREPAAALTSAPHQPVLLSRSLTTVVDYAERLDDPVKPTEPTESEALQAQSVSRPEPAPLPHPRAMQTSPTPPLGVDPPASNTLSDAVALDASQPHPRPYLKRQRPASDVDGPNTATLCCKKRRLRRYLITSRLSQPFSQPATHILNRECVAAGDKRFLKLAAVINARRIMQLPRSSLMPAPLSPPSVPLLPHPNNTDDANTRPVAVPHPPSPSEALRRQAMTMCFRRRYFTEAARGQRMTGVPLQLMATARLPAWAAPPQNQPQQQISSSTALFMLGQRSGALQQLIGKSTEQPFKLPSERHGAVSLSVPRPQQAQTHGCAIDQASSLIPNSPLPHSAELNDCGVQEGYRLPAKTITTANNDQYDDGEGYCAFPFSESESESRYDELSDDPDPDDVYSDFSVLFQASDDDSDVNEEKFDDYMDELDGIAHLPR